MTRSTYRAKSLVRRAFAAAVEGHAKAVAADAWPDTSVEVAAAKLSRVLGPDGDMNPPWTLLDLAAKANPETLLSCLCAELGFEAPVRVAAPTERSLERLAESVSDMREQLEDIAADVRAARGMAKSTPNRRAGAA